MVQHADIDHTGVTGVSGGFPSGTSFPGSPASNDVYYRTDRDVLYFYDGTRWLTLTLYEAVVTQVTAPTADAFYTGWLPTAAASEIYLVDWVTCTLVSATSVWEFKVQYHDSASTATLIASTSTSGDAANTWTRHSATIGAVVNSAALVIGFLADEISGTASFNGGGRLRYRLVG